MLGFTMQAVRTRLFYRNTLGFIKEEQIVGVRQVKGKTNRSTLEMLFYNGGEEFKQQQLVTH